LLHVSELADHKVENPEDVVEVGQELEVKILRVDPEERKIGLSLKRVQWAAEDAEQEEGKAEPKHERARLGGLQGSSEDVDSMVSDVLLGAPVVREDLDESEEAEEEKPVEEQEKPAAEEAKAGAEDAEQASETLMEAGESEAEGEKEEKPTEEREKPIAEEKPEDRKTKAGAEDTEQASEAAEEAGESKGEDESKENESAEA